MRRKASLSPSRVGRVCGLLLVAAALLVGASNAVAAEVVYKNIPSSLPGNTVSQGFECCQTSEFGGAIRFPANTARRSAIVKVGMSSWACVTGTAEGNDCVTPAGSKFSLPVTLNVYELEQPGNKVGPKVATKTQVFEMPYRPTASKKCTTGSAKGGWYGPDGNGGKACFHGKLFFIKFRTAQLLPPGEAVVSVAYNTNTAGYTPTGVQGPADSLNVALTRPALPFEPNPSVGEYPNPKEDYAYSFYEFEDPMCGGELGKFGPTGPCDEGFQPLFEVKAS